MGFRELPGMFMRVGPRVGTRDAGVGGREMRALFATYLLIIVAGLAYFIALGVAGR
jgi:hypothetical protein